MVRVRSCPAFQNDFDFREGDDGDDNSLIADREVDHLTNGVHNGEKMDSQSHISDSTCTIDIDRDNEDKTKLDEGIFTFYHMFSIKNAIFCMICDILQIDS